MILTNYLVVIYFRIKRENRNLRQDEIDEYNMRLKTYKTEARRRAEEKLESWKRDRDQEKVFWTFFPRFIFNSVLMMIKT